MADGREDPAMRRRGSSRTWIIRLAAITLAAGVLWAAPRLLTSHQLNVARTEGVFATPEEGMFDLLAKSYVKPEHTWIFGAGPNEPDGRNPHVWYVVACVCGGHRANSTLTGNWRGPCDMPGTFFVNTKEGWVHVPEGLFTFFVGGWMKDFGLAGPGLPPPAHAAPRGTGRCVP
jgi:hypothetical protein